MAKTLVGFKLPLHDMNLEPISPNSTKVAFFRDGRKSPSPILGIGEWIKLFVRLLSRKTGWMERFQETKDQFVPLRVISHNEKNDLNSMRKEVERFRRGRPILPSDLRRYIRRKKPIIRGGVQFSPLEDEPSPKWTFRRAGDPNGLSSLLPFEIEFCLLVEFGALILRDEWVAEYLPKYSVPWLPARNSRAWSEEGILLDEDAITDWEDVPILNTEIRKPSLPKPVIEKPSPSIDVTLSPQQEPIQLNILTAGVDSTDTPDRSASRLLSLIVEAKALIENIQIPPAQQALIAALGGVMPLAEQGLRSLGIVPEETSKINPAAMKDLERMHETLKQIALSELSARAEAISTRESAIAEALRKIAEAGAELTAQEARISSARESLNKSANELEQTKLALNAEHEALQSNLAKYNAASIKLIQDREQLESDFEALTIESEQIEPKRRALDEARAKLELDQEEFHTKVALEREQLEEERNELTELREMIKVEIEKISLQQRELDQQRTQFDAERNKSWKQVLRELGEPAQS